MVAKYNFQTDICFATRNLNCFEREKAHFYKVLECQLVKHRDYDMFDIDLASLSFDTSLWGFQNYF